MTQDVHPIPTVVVAVLVALTATPETTAQQIGASGYVDIAVATDEIRSRALVDYGGTRWFLYQAWETLLVEEVVAPDEEGPRLRVDRPRPPDVSQLAFESANLTFGRVNPHGVYHRMIEPFNLRAWSSAFRERDTFSVNTASDAEKTVGALASFPAIDAWYVRHGDDWESVGCTVGPGRRRKPVALVLAREASLTVPDLTEAPWTFERSPRREVSSDRVGVVVNATRRRESVGITAEWWTRSERSAGSLAAVGCRARHGLFEVRAHGRYASDLFYAPDGDAARWPGVLSAELAAGRRRDRLSASLRWEGEGPANAPTAEWEAAPSIRGRLRGRLPVEVRLGGAVRGAHTSQEEWVTSEAIVVGGSSLRVTLESDRADGRLNELDVGIRAHAGPLTVSSGATVGYPDCAWSDLAVRVVAKPSARWHVRASIASRESATPTSITEFVGSGDYRAEIVIRRTLNLENQTRRLEVDR